MKGTIMENEEFGTPDIHFSREVAKHLIISTAVSAGVLVGIAATGFAYSKMQTALKNRKAKKATQPQD
jgi:hypothetical protein